MSLGRPLHLGKYLEVLSQGGGRPSPGLRPPLKGIETASIIRRHENVAVFVSTDKRSCFNTFERGAEARRRTSPPWESTSRNFPKGMGRPSPTSTPLSNCFPLFAMICHCFSMAFHFFHGFPLLSIAVHCFSIVFHCFSMVSHCFSMVSHCFQLFFIVFWLSIVSYCFQ